MRKTMSFVLLFGIVMLSGVNPCPAADTGAVQAKPAAKKPIKQYLEARLGEIAKQNKTMQDFGQKIAGEWQDFWDTMKDSRVLFEIRLAKQRENLFDSLKSLPKADWQGTISDFENLQQNLIDSFEIEQKKKTLAFQTKLEKQYKTFFSQQEKWQNGFVESGNAIWRDLKQPRGAKK